MTLDRVDGRMSLVELQALLEQEQRHAPAPQHHQDSSSPAWLDDVTLIAQRLTGLRMAFVSILDSSTAHFVAQKGVELAPQPRAATLCDLVAQAQRPVVICDAAAAPELARYPAVQDGVRTYVGVPVGQDAGNPLSFALCVADERPSADASEVVQVLEALGRLVLRTLEWDSTRAVQPRS